MEINKKKLLLITAVITTVVLVSSYGVATYFEPPIATKYYDLRIYLHETEDVDAQIDDIGTIIITYYEEQLTDEEKGLVLPILDRNGPQPTFVETMVTDINLQNIVSLLESHGYRVSYWEIK